MVKTSLHSGVALQLDILCPYPAVLYKQFLDSVLKLYCQEEQIFDPVNKSKDDTAALWSRDFVLLCISFQQESSCYSSSMGCDVDSAYGADVHHFLPASVDWGYWRKPRIWPHGCLFLLCAWQRWRYVYMQRHLHIIWYHSQWLLPRNHSIHWIICPFYAHRVRSSCDVFLLQEGLRVCDLWSPGTYYRYVSLVYSYRELVLQNWTNLC